jgi:apolipoprotein N-acyltransferase
MRRHELDPVSLVFGVAFTSAGLLFLAGRIDQAVRLRWLWPVLLLALGLAILLDLNVRRPKPAAEPAAAVEEAEPAGPVEAADRAEPVESEATPTTELEPETPESPPPDRDR